MKTPILGIGSRVKHPDFGVGVVIQAKANAHTITFIHHGRHEIPLQDDRLEVLEAEKVATDVVSLAQVEASLRRILNEYSDIQQRVELGERWVGGTLVLKPSDQTKKSKEIPIETFFHKIVMLRDRLRVMEQRVNASDKLDDEDKVNLQQYLTRIYGSLTTFNVLFRDKEDQFVGAKES